MHYLVPFVRMIGPKNIAYIFYTSLLTQQHVTTKKFKRNNCFSDLATYFLMNHRLFSKELLGINWSIKLPSNFRYVAFDSLGFKLITGISLWACSANANSTPLVVAQNGPTSSANNSNPSNNSGPGTGNNGGTSNNGGGNSGPGAGGTPRADDDSQGRPPPDTPGAAQDMIVNSYQTLVQRYDSLVRNYQRLFMVRHRLINTPPLANTVRNLIFDLG